MALDFTEMVVKMAKAARESERADERAKSSNDALRRALETLESRTRSIIARRDDDPENVYEVAFLEEALAEVREADRRVEVEHAQAVAARRHHHLLVEIVEGLKPPEG